MPCSQHALATEQEFFSEVAADHAQQRGGNPDNRRPVQVASSSSVNLVLVTGIGAVALIGPQGPAW